MSRPVFVLAGDPLPTECGGRHAHADNEAAATSSHSGVWQTAARADEQVEGLRSGQVNRAMIIQQVLGAHLSLVRMRCSVD